MLQTYLADAAKAAGEQISQVGAADADGEVQCS